MYRNLLILTLCIFLGGCMVGSNVSVSDLGRPAPTFDPDNPLLKERIVFVSGQINNSVANAACEKIAYLNEQSGTEPIKLVINSGGGDTTAYLAIANMMKSVSAPVDTINISFCGSAAADLFLSATGKRYALQDSVFLIHDCRGQSAKLVKIYSKLQEDLLRSKAQLPSKWLPLKNQEFVLTAKQAEEYKLVDQIIPKMDIHN
jgi:ATP-dependent Clp protease, protease subunit